MVTAPGGGGGGYYGFGSGNPNPRGSGGGGGGGGKGGGFWSKILKFFEKIGIDISIDQDPDVHQSFLCTDANGKVAYGPGGYPYMCSYDSKGGWNITLNGELVN